MIEEMISPNIVMPTHDGVDIFSGRKAKRDVKARKSTVRKRLDPIERKQKILAEAISFFAKHGLDAQIKDLAAKIGISEGLIFSYFGTKQKLIDAVYEGIGFTSWFKAWEAHLRDGSISLRERLGNYYFSYLQTMEDPNWIGITIFATVTGRCSPPQMRAWGDKMIRVVAEELRAHFSPNKKGRLGQLEIEMAWHLHSTFTHYFIRKYLYRIPVIGNHETFVAAVVDNFLDGCGARPNQKDR